MKKRLIFVFLILTAVGSASPAYGTRMSVEPARIQPGKEQQVNIVLDTEGEHINAFEFSLKFPNGIRVQRVVSEDLISNLLLQQPTLTSSTVIVNFIGIIPGGFRGTKGRILRVTLTAARSGRFPITVQRAQVLLNDGSGTETSFSTKVISLVAAEDVVPTPAPPADRVAPEDFVPILAHDPAIFDDDYFIVFNTVDTGSGIDHYEVIEVPRGTPITDSGPWEIAVSPHRLRDQFFQKDVYVKAIDRAGNFIIVKVKLPDGITRFWRPQSALFLLLALLILLVLLLLLLRRRPSRRSAEAS